MLLCLYAYLRVSFSGFLTVSDKGSLTTIGELFNISALDPLLPTLLIATLCLCTLLTILYYSLVIAWEVFWASRRSPSPLDPSAEVVLTSGSLTVSVIVTLCWVKAFLLQCIAVTPKAKEVFTNIWCPVNIVDGAESCPLHMP